MRDRKLLVVVMVAFLGTAIYWPIPAHADIPSALKTYTVWNQFDATVRTFQRIGLIMSDSRYQGLFFGVIVLGLVAGGVYTMVRAMLEGRHPGYAWVQWLGVVLFGVIFYFAFIRPTTQITIYDEALNATATVGGIPDGVAFIAGLSNVIETGLVEMIWTSGDPRSYRDGAGGLAFNILDKAFRGGVDLAGGDPDGQYINMSIRRYIEDCLFFEIVRPGTILNVNDFHTTTDFRPLFAEAANPAIYTVWFDSSNKGGATVTCQEAWTNLSVYLNNMTDSAGNVVKFWTERCAEAGYGPNSTGGAPVDLVSVCRQKAASTVGLVTGAGPFSTAHIMRQYLIAREMWNIYTKYNPDEAIAALSSRAAGSSLVGMGIMANEWIPIVRSVVFSVFVGMMPFLCILLVTPLFPRAISFMFGTFIFLTAWGICDALVHSYAIDKTLDLFVEVNNGNLGLKSMMLFSPVSQKTLAMFGAARWSAIMVAGVFSSLIARFGGAVLAHFAGNLAGLRRFGAAAGESVMNPQKWASEVRATKEVVPTTTYANAGWHTVASIEAYRATREITAGMETIERLGGSPVSAGIQMGRADAMRAQESISHMEAVKEYAQSTGLTEAQVIRSLEQYRTASAGGSATALRNLARDLKTDAFSAMNFLQDVGLRRSYGKAQGLADAYSNAKAEYGFMGNMNDYVAMQAELEAQKGFLDASAVEKYGSLYRTGKEGFLKDYAEFRMGQTASMLDKLRAEGLTPGNVGLLLGRLEADRKLADSEFVREVGDRAAMMTRLSQNYNELSKMAIRQALNDIGQTGQIRGDTRAIMKQIMGTREGRGQMRAQGIGDLVIDSEAAAGFARYLKNHGFNVPASDLVNATVQMNLAPNEDGSLSPSMVVSKKGQKIAEFDMREADYRRVQRGVKQGRGWWHGSFAGYEFVSGTREDAGNWVHIKGVTKDGHIVELQGSKQGGQEAIIHEDVKQGATYNGAAFMAEKGNVPVEVFRDEMKSAAFAMQYSKEWDKAYQGRLSKQEAVRVATELQGKVGGAMSVPFFGANGSIGKSSIEVLNDSEVSSTDVLTRVAIGINMSSMTVRQKQAAYQELNRMIRDIKTDKAEELPSASYIRHRGEKPLGEIRQPKH